MSDEMNPEAQPPDEGDDKTPLEQFIFHQRRGLEEFGKAMESLLPPGFKEHTQAASSEFATGFRVLIDAAIDEIKKASEMEDPDEHHAEEQERRASANLAGDENDDETRAGSGGGRIKVEVDD